MVLLLLTPLFAQDPSNMGGRKAPNFSVEDIDGNAIQLKNLAGKVVLLNFWATWCKPCLEEMGEHQKIYNEFKDSGFVLLAIATDDQRSENKIAPLVKTKKITFPVLHDKNSVIARKYYAQSIPYTVLIDKKGTIIYNHLGYKKGDEIALRKRIADLLK
jgi:peroxiredoxin